MRRIFRVFSLLYIFDEAQPLCGLGKEERTKRENKIKKPSIFLRRIHVSYQTKSVASVVVYMTWNPVPANDSSINVFIFLLKVSLSGYIGKSKV